MTSLVQSESGEWREMGRRGKDAEKRRGYVPSPSFPTQLSLSPLSECLNGLKNCPLQFAFRQVNRKGGGCADITLRRIMAKITAAFQRGSLDH